MPEARGALTATGCYVYGVVPAHTAADPTLLGIDGGSVERIIHGDIAAATTVVPLDRPAGRRAELLAHNAVVNALAEAGPVLPVQFGSIMADRDSVVDRLLAPEHDRLVQQLERLEGRRQFNLRASYVTDQVLTEVVQRHPEIADLRRRTRDLPEGSLHPELIRLGELVSRAVEETREADAEAVLDIVRPLSLEHSARPGRGVDDVVSVSMLVEDTRIADLEDHLEEFAEAVHERMRLRLVGPVAPYDFVEAPSWG
jgi:hypothetical protein